MSDENRAKVLPPAASPLRPPPFSSRVRANRDCGRMGGASQGRSWGRPPPSSFSCREGIRRRRAAYGAVADPLPTYIDAGSGRNRRRGSDRPSARRTPPLVRPPALIRAPEGRLLVRGQVRWPQVTDERHRPSHVASLCGITQMGESGRRARAARRSVAVQSSPRPLGRSLRRVRLPLPRSRTRLSSV